MLCFKPISSVLHLSTITSSSNSVSNGVRSVAVHCSPQRVLSVFPLKLEGNGGKEEALSEKFNEEREKFEAEDYNEERDKFEEEERRIGGIDVPRQKYIAVPKAELLDAVLDLFESEEDKESFKQFARCLDSILHAEHKDLLEEMRAYYSLTHQDEEEEMENSEINRQKTKLNGEQNNLNGLNLNLNRSLDFKTLLASSPWVASKRPINQNRVAFAANFQRNFMKLLKDAQFEELSARDLLLTYALNSDYILTLPIYVDWKKASDSNAIIFRRGYASERQKGLLLVEKLDYLQSKLLQRIFFGLSKPLKNLGKFINEAVKRSTGNQDLQIQFQKLKFWLNEQYSPDSLLVNRESKSGFEESGNPNTDLPIWIAAQKAVSRYEGLLSPVGPRGRLIRKLLSWTGLVGSLPEASVSLETEKEKYLENYLRPNFLPRVTLANIWEPATRGNNLWEILKASINILLKESTLQEPAFQELILFHTDGENQNREREKDREEILPLKLKIYENIPIPDLPVVFPHKKLSFRILDTIRLDIATIVGSLAYFVNYKFENIATSPSALLLDAVAATALAILVFRVVLGYKQTSDRYQLLVNKTLYEKTLASGFGSVHFLLDASEQQQYKEAVLVYALLLSPKTYKVASVKRIQAACEQFVYDKFREKIEMPIDKATETLLRFNLVNEFLDYEEIRKMTPVSCSEACEILKNRWQNLLEKNEK
ncbi:hypothetical protein LUZ60_007345 [Juncus effusus]|nr:hypothetical protein LUZ60_007345 [Juncus effusus]